MWCPRFPTVAQPSSYWRDNTRTLPPTPELSKKLLNPFFRENLKRQKLPSTMRTTCKVNMHGTITRPMLQRPDYLDEYIAFWNARPEIVRIWISLYTPQKEECAAEMLTAADRERVAAELPRLRKRYPKLLANEGISQA